MAGRSQPTAPTRPMTSSGPAANGIALIVVCHRDSSTTRRATTGEAWSASGPTVRMYCHACQCGSTRRGSRARGASCAARRAHPPSQTPQTGTLDPRQQRRLALVLCLQRLEALHKTRLITARDGYVAQIHEQADGVVVIRGLFRRDQALDLGPHGGLSARDLLEVLRACHCLLVLASLPFGCGSRCRCAAVFVGGFLRGAQQLADGSR